MTWWTWIVLGLGLAAAELLSDTAFYLLSAGAAALAVGLMGLAGLPLPPWAQWLAFSTIALLSMGLFRRALYERLRPAGGTVRNPALDAIVMVAEELGPEKHTRVMLHGSRWPEINSGDRTIAAGEEARVVAVDGVELRLERWEPDGAV